MLTQSFAEAVLEAEKIIASAPHVQSAQDLAEGYDYLAGSIQASLHLAWAYQRDFPYFVQSTGPYTKLGLDNPDALYLHSYVRDDAEYVVTGRRGSTRDLSFQILNGDYSPVEVPDSLTAFDDRRLEIGPDGAFELRFGPPRPAAPANYVPLGSGSAMLIVREVYSDWSRERRGTLRIQRADKIGLAPRAPDAALLDAETMRSVAPEDWPRLGMRTHPALAIVDCEWRVDELLRGVENAAGADGSLRTPERSPVSVLVWRRGSQVHHRALEKPDHAALELARAGTSFSAICEAVAAESGDDSPGGPVALINRLLARWLADALLILADG